MLITTNMFKNKKFQAKLKSLKFKHEKDCDEERFVRDFGDERLNGVAGNISIELLERFNRVDIRVATPSVDEWHVNDEYGSDPDALIEEMRKCANVTNEINAVFKTLVELVKAVSLADETTRNDFVSVKLERDCCNSDGTCVVYGVNSGGDKTEVGRIKINDFMTQEQIEDKVQECLKRYYDKNNKA